MFIQFGKHWGTSIELLLLKQPDYIRWMLSQQGTTRNFCEARQEACRLIRAFNEKPILKPCQNLECGNCATRATVYQGSVRPIWWCNHCDPYRLGASPGKLHIIQTYGDAGCYVGTFCSGRK